jgi:hypothetical protein
VTPISNNQPGQGVNRFTVDDIKRETVRAFKPLRCEVQDFDYDSGFEFSVFDAEDPALVYMGKLRTSQYQDPKALAEVFRRWRIVVAAKGHELTLGPRRRDRYRPTRSNTPSLPRVAVLQRLR